MTTRQQILWTDNLRAGLRRFGRTLRNTFQLVELRNAECLADGIHTFDEMVDAFNGNESIDWPGPQMFKGDDGVIRLFEDTVLSTINPSAFPWVATSVTTYNFDSLGDTKSIPSGSAWQFADFGRSWMAFNGSAVVMYMPESPSGAKVVVVDTVAINSGCSFRGRALYGGLGVSTFWTAEWKTYYETLAEEQIDGSSYTLTAGNNFVWWSSIGGGDLLWPFDLDRAMTGFIDDGWHDQANDRPALKDVLQRNEWGIMPMPWSGTVQAMLPLGKSVMVYGSDGISALTLETSPISTFGLHNIMDIGIAGRSAVAGDERGHLFVDETGSAWLIGPELVPQKLHYDEFFLSMVGDDLVVTHDPVDNKYFICNETDGFVLTQQGLSEIWQSPTTLVHHPTSAVAFTKAIGMYADNGLGLPGKIKTDVFDFGTNGIGTIHGVEVGGVQDAAVNVKIHRRANMDSAFAVTGNILVDESGLAAMTVSGLEFQVEINVTNADESTIANMNIDFVRVFYSLDGKKSINYLTAGL